MVMCMKSRKFKGYYLLENHRLYYPKWLVFVDTETISVKVKLQKRTKLPKYVEANLQKLRLGYFEIWVKRERKQSRNGFVIGRKGNNYVVYDLVYANWFTTREEFINYIIMNTNPNENVWIFAYNMAFDFRILYNRQLFAQFGLELKKWIVDSQRFYMKFKRKDGKGNIIFIDVMHYVGGRISLKKLAEKTGLRQKLNTLQKYNYNVENIPLDELKEYVKVDVEIIREYILHFIKYIFGLGSFKMTLAGVSLSIYRHTFMKKKIVRIKNDEYLKWVKKAYFGGRTEVFYLNPIDECYYLDFNSLYPYVMKSYRYPVKMLYFLEAENRQDEILLVKYALRYLNNPNYNIIMEGEFYVPEDLPYGVLPVRDKKGKVYYVVGRVYGIYAEPEIRLVLELGGKILRVRKLAIYKAEKIFEEFVNYFYQEKLRAKEQNDSVAYWNAKIIMNSLYGKFAQRITKFKRAEEYDFLPDGVFGLLEENKEVVVVCGKAYIKEENEVYTKLSAPEIAVFVTSYARYTLAKALFRTRAYYCDTDSIVIPKEELPKFQDQIGNELGQLKVERIMINAQFLKPKWYKWIEDGKEKMKLKGLPKNAQLVQENEKEAVFEAERGIGYRESLRWFSLENEIPMFFFKVIKRFEKEYDKGKVMPDGWVRPLRFDEIEDIIL